MRRAQPFGVEAIARIGRIDAEHREQARLLVNDRFVRVLRVEHVRQKARVPCRASPMRTGMRVAATAAAVRHGASLRMATS